jgi:hypothetical protein
LHGHEAHDTGKRISLRWLIAALHSVDCEGGGITVELARDDKSTLVRLDSIRIWRNNKPDEDGFPLSGGADDRVFRLDRASLDKCRSLVTDRQELAAMRRK